MASYSKTEKVRRKFVVNITGVSYTTAGRKIQECKDSLGKSKMEKLTEHEFCEFYDIK